MAETLRGLLITLSVGLSTPVGMGRAARADKENTPSCFY